MMKFAKAGMLGVCAGLVGCAQGVSLVSISSIPLPAPVMVEGQVIAKEESSFTLRDATGEVAIDVEDEGAMELVNVGDTVRVIGVADDDASLGKEKPTVEELDAYELHFPATGKQLKLAPWR